MTRHLLALVFLSAALAQTPQPSPFIGGGTSSGTGDVVGPSSATDTAIAIYDSTTGKLIKNTGCTINANNQVSCPGGAAFGAASGKTGFELFTGVTSGSAGFTVADVAGTQILYMLPVGSGAANSVLSDTGAATCPTLPAGSPTNCHQLAWVPNGGGGGTPGLVLIEQHTASASATLDFTSCITSTYDEYQIHMVSLIPATNTVSIYMRMSTDGGSTYDSGTNYEWGRYYISTGGSAASGANGSYTGIAWWDTDMGNASSGGLNGVATLYNPLSAAVYKLVDLSVMGVSATGGYFKNMFIQRWKNTAAMNAFRFVASSGNLTSGTVRCYGVTK